MARKKAESSTKSDITKKLNKEQKLFCYLYIVEDYSMRDAYKMMKKNTYNFKG